ncbi:MAG: hypothetical protein QOH37_17 [Nocardioidaceae bacterium]|nr:hypothetical protein [Nocardioidaceae bacterium]
MTGHGSTWRIVRGGRLVPLFATRSPYVLPVLSANGRHVAWAVSQTLHRDSRFVTEQAYTLVAYDVAAGQVIASTGLTTTVTCCDAGGAIRVLGVDADGTVVALRTDDKIWRWHPGSAVVLLTGIRAGGADGVDQWPGGVSWRPVRGEGAFYGRVGAAGEVVRAGRVPESEGGRWSPDGTSYVYQPFSKGTDHAPVVWTRDGRVRLHVRHLARIIGWEPRRSVIVSVARREHQPRARVAVLLRCHARTGACERAGVPLHGATLPEYLT